MRGLLLGGLGLLACQAPTQIRVQIDGTCTGVGVIARNQMNDASDVSTVNTSGECLEGAVLDIVLVPETGSEAVEVLVIASLGATRVDECVGHYAAALAGTTCESASCADCVFARRSLQFGDGESRALIVTLDETCAGELACDLTETCEGGDCVSAATSCDEDGACDLEEGA